VGYFREVDNLKREAAQVKAKAEQVTREAAIKEQGNNRKVLEAAPEFYRKMAALGVKEAYASGKGFFSIGVWGYVFKAFSGDEWFRSRADYLVTSKGEVYWVAFSGAERKLIHYGQTKQFVDEALFGMHQALEAASRSRS
jgi:hypothetical protein